MWEPGSVVGRRLVRRLCLSRNGSERFFRSPKAELKLVDQRRVRNQDAVQIVQEFLLVHELGFKLDEARFIILRLRHRSVIVDSDPAIEKGCARLAHR